MDGLPVPEQLKFIIPGGILRLVPSGLAQVFLIPEGIPRRVVLPLYPVYPEGHHQVVPVPPCGHKGTPADFDFRRLIACKEIILPHILWFQCDLHPWLVCRLKLLPGLVHPFRPGYVILAVASGHHHLAFFRGSCPDVYAGQGASGLQLGIHPHAH